MSATKKESSPLRVMNVSARDRGIYQAVMIGGKPQRAVALEHQLSQSRVSAIIKRVTRWLSQGDPPGLGELYRRDRLRAVSRLHRMRLEQLLVEAIEAWHKSESSTHTVKERIVNGKVVSHDTQVHTHLRDRRYLADICAITDRIVGFEGFDKLGKVDESCKGRIYEEPERTPVDTYREFKRRTILGGFDTPGDEGIPGMWEKEMEQRNGEVRRKKIAGRKEAGAASRESGVECQKEQAERQLAANSLSAVPRGEGQAACEDRANGEEAQITPASPPQVRTITATTSQQSCDSPVLKPTELLSKNSTDSSEVTSQPAVTTSNVPEKSLSKTPPKVPRYRLMGTAAEMAVSKSYDEFFSAEERLARALEKAAAGTVESRQQGPQRPTPSPHRPAAAGNIATVAKQE